MGWTHRDDGPHACAHERRRSPSPGTDRADAPLLTVDEALAADDRLLALKAHTLTAVVALVPASVALFLSLSRRRAVESGVALIAPGAPIDPQALWQRYVADVQTFDPFAPHLHSRTDATVLMLQQVEARAPRYREHMRTVGWSDRMVAYLRIAGTIAAVVSLHRTAGEPRFSVADASGLRRVQPLLEHVYASAVQPTRAGMREVLLQSGLSPREAEVAELAARGASNADIARSLYVSEATVKTHMAHIFTKLGVRTRTQLAVVAGGAAPDG
jgi:DNA-binding CsgD family transcriptional regulator